MIKNLENQLLASNLKTVDNLSRQGLLLFLDLERSKSSTARLRAKARLVVINKSGGEVDRDLARIALNV